MPDLIHSHPNRRHDIDWLRSLAFIALIFYHIGMYYVADWGWHVKSQYQSTFLQNLMLLVNPWRMSLLFFISGFALCLVEPKISTINLLKLRFIRILVPVIIGMNLIVIPQPYFEAVQQHGYNGGLGNFLIAYFDANTELLPQMQHSSAGLVTWNHLWYLVYLWHYTLVYLLIKPLLIRFANSYRRSPISMWAWFLTLASALTLIESALRPTFPSTHALVDDWYNHARYFVVFIFGYITAKSPRQFADIVRYRHVLLGCVMPLYLLRLIKHHTPWLAMDGLAGKLSVTFLMVFGALCCLFAAVGYAGRYLNQPHPALRYLNEAVLPWYILHQTLIIILAMSLAPLALGGLIEAFVLSISTFISCAVCFELIRRWNVTRVIFGMKLMSAK